LPLPAHRVRLVASFDELVTTPFANGINALCWPRQLAGDFQVIIDQLQPGAGITTIDADDLAALSLSPTGALARDTLRADLALLEAHGLAPTLDCINGYERDAPDGPIPTDVYSFHVDSAPVPADTYLCTYAGASSEGLTNEQAIRRVDDPAIRAALLAVYGGADDANFSTYLSDNHYDLHYQPLPDAAPYSFGQGNLWRLAIATPTSPVPPCIHRAPLTPPGAPPRLLLIS
jgi:hypothetical protein